MSLSGKQVPEFCQSASVEKREQDVEQKSEELQREQHEAEATRRSDTGEDSPWSTPRRSMSTEATQYTPPLSSFSAKDEPEIYLVDTDGTAEHDYFLLEDEVLCEGKLPSSIRNLKKALVKESYATFAYFRENTRTHYLLPRLVNFEDLPGWIDQTGLNFFTPWRSNGEYIEVNDDLLARFICPADLAQYPCPWDGLQGYGCGMVRLCRNMRKYGYWGCRYDYDSNTHVFYDVQGRQYRCPHLHDDVLLPSCRFICATPPQDCIASTQKGDRPCAAGHDFRLGRMLSRARLESHIKDAIMAGARMSKPKRCTLARQELHLPTPWLGWTLYEEFAVRKQFMDKLRMYLGWEVSTKFRQYGEDCVDAQVWLQHMEEQELDSKDMEPGTWDSSGALRRKEQKCTPPKDWIGVYLAKRRGM